MEYQTLKKNNIQDSIKVKTIFGVCIIDEPILIQLIQSDAMQRLRKIHQYGFAYYAKKRYDFNRFDHSVGVLHLLMKAGVSVEEQIAGLLHDVSHTAFSHIADVLFVHDNPNNSYQDDIHEWFINRSDIPCILSQYGVRVEQILHKNKQFKALEQDLPALCADRIEYLLHGAILEKLITRQELETIIDHLHFDGTSWFFDCAESARKIAQISLDLTEFHFAADWNVACYQWGAQVLRLALDRNIINLDDIHFLYDALIWQKLMQSDDAGIQQLLQRIKMPDVFFRRATAIEATIFIKPKCRGVDPLVSVAGNYVQLSTLDNMFANSYKRLQNQLHDGLYLVLY